MSGLSGSALTCFHVASSVAGSEIRLASYCGQLTVARIARDDRAAPATERVHRGLLHLRVDAEDDRARRRALPEIARAPLRERVAGVLADERLGVRRLYAGRAELERGVARDVRQRLVPVHTLV